jgi:excisionase family DNA binding protein
MSVTATKRMPFASRLTCSVREACEATGLSPPTIYRLIHQGRLATRRAGRKRLIVVASLLDALSLGDEVA